jgi:5'-nucleotidase
MESKSVSLGWVNGSGKQETHGHHCSPLTRARRLVTINSLPPNLIYKSATATAEELIPGLRAQGCELIIALTHMREPNDLKLAEKTTKGLIDLILGGHDHYYNHEVCNQTHVLRSGTDFRQLSYIEARRRAGSKGWDFNITRRDIERAIPEDGDTLKLVDKLSSSMKGKLEKPVGYTAAALDGRFTTVRLKESNLGNFVCDLMMHFYDCECCILASGTIRGDQVYPPGVLRMKDIMTCFPFEDPVVVLKVTGQAILDALENSVSTYPALEGRFPQVAGIVFEYDPQLPPNKRVLWTKVAGVELDKRRIYKLATRGYMGRGKDGFDSLLVKSEGGVAEEIVSEENGILISTLLRQYFLSMKILGRWRRMISLHGHWDGIKSKLHEVHCVKQSSHPKKKQYKERVLGPHDDSTSLHNASPRELAEGGKLVYPKELRETAEGEEMVDSDSDGSVVLDDHETCACDHPLMSSDAGDATMTHEESDRLYHIARTYGKYWMELAGVKRHDVGLVDEHEGDRVPSWTKGIAPRVEGRIIRSTAGEL